VSRHEKGPRDKSDDEQRDISGMTDRSHKKHKKKREKSEKEGRFNQRKSERPPKDRHNRGLERTDRDKAERDRTEAYHLRPSDVFTEALSTARHAN
jgi:hypothetical protein